MTLKVDNIQNENASEANVVLNTDGSISIPNQIKHVGDDNTLIEFETDTVKLQTGGTSRVTVDSSGNVGIGTTSPSVKLHTIGDVMVQGEGGTGEQTLFIGKSAAVLPNSRGVAVAADQDAAAFHDMVLKTSTNTSGLVEQVRITSGGDVNIANGNLVLANGKGIDFSADANASGMTSELLDDYEEGTWTPQMRFGGTSHILTGTQLGSYTKIGNRVYILCCIVLTSKGTSTGSATIEGLPFTSVGSSVINYHNSPLSVTFFSLNSLDGGSARTKANGTLIDLFQEGQVTLTMNNTHFNNTSQIQLAGFYETTA